MALRQVTHTHDSSGNIATSPLDSDISEVSQRESPLLESV